MKNYHLQLAGKYSVSAHNNWLAALRESTQDVVKADALRAGDADWLMAEKHLRHVGTGVDNITDAERKMLTQDECFNPDNSNYELVDEVEHEIDFKPLERAHRLDTATKFLRMFVFATLLVMVGFLSGIVAGRDTPDCRSDAEKLTELRNLDIKLNGGKGVAK